MKNLCKPTIYRCVDGQEVELAPFEDQIKNLEGHQKYLIAAKKAHQNSRKSCLESIKFPYK